MTATPRTDETPYMIQLDALRAFAVLGVLIHHFIPESFINSIIPIGALGVRFFFVLSGFLITGILLRCKEKIDSAQQNHKWILRQFYIRRFLRIFPIYYLTIAITYILNLEGTRETIWWNLTYTTNIYVAQIGHWVGSVSHFWSLSVEEQFYIFWPFLILCLPEKYLLKIIINSIFVAPLFRLILTIFGIKNGVTEYVLIFSNLDSLGMGALLAYFIHKKPHTPLLNSFVCQGSFWLGLPLFVICRLLYTFKIESAFQFIIDDTISAIFYMWVVWRASKGFGGILGQILEKKPLLYIGKISYGIYLYHLFVLSLYGKLAWKWGLPYPQAVGPKFILLTTITLGLASVSWFIFEKPINDLKKYFPYS